MIDAEKMAGWARLAEAGASDARANRVFTAAAFAAPRHEVLAGIAEYVADWRRLAREAVPALLAEVERLREEVELERLRYGRQRARCAVFMGVMATLAREGDARAKAWVAAADDAALSVRPEDFVVAHVNAEKP